MKLFCILLSALSIATSCISQTLPTIDSVHLFGKWRTTEIRGNGWSWDVNRWQMKYANDTIRISTDSIGNFPMPKPTDLQGTGFDLLAGNAANVYFAAGIFIPKKWRFESGHNRLYVAQRHPTDLFWEPFIEKGALKLKLVTGTSHMMIVEKIF